jgi:hypothetical protein
MQRVGIVLWRVLKILPVVGWFFVIAAAPIILRRKGYFLGAVAVALDMLPVICLVKAGIEVFNGDIIPDKFDVHVTPELTQRLEAASL